MHSFQLSERQYNQLQVWLEKVAYPKAVDAVREKLSEDDFKSLTEDGQYPYYGAIGGGLTFKFTPTGLGVVTKVEESITGEEIDLTDYSQW